MLYQLDKAVVFAKYRRNSCSFFIYRKNLISRGRSPPEPNFDFSKIQNSEVKVMGEHPKRRKDKYNPYSIYEMEGTYFVSFKDGQGALNRYEITKELYDAFNSFELEDLSYLNVWDRHMEQSEIWEPKLNERALDVQESVEDIVMRNLQNEKVHRAIGMLPEVQKRRIKMYFFDGMTYEEIAARENCIHPAVVKSVKAALEKLKIILEE